MAHEPLRSELIAAMGRVLDESAFAGGKYVESFENAFASYCGTKHAIGVGSGTEALWFILKALGIGAGDEVVTTPCTFFATAEAILQTGAKPVFADIDEKSYNIAPARIESAITERTKAIVPVHLFGQLADMDSILEIGDRHGIPVVEDAAQAHGARSGNGSMAGSLGIAGAFSFYPSKNLGALGDAGAVVTDDESLASEIRTLRNHGQTAKYLHDKVGWNGRMDGMQASVLEIKLRELDAKNEARRSIARRYNELLDECSQLKLPACDRLESHVFHIYSVVLENRDSLRSALEQRGVECGIHYPVPLHRQTACSSLRAANGDYPVAERCSERFLSLPLFPEMSDEQVSLVVDSIRGCFGN